MFICRRSSSIGQTCIYLSLFPSCKVCFPSQLDNECPREKERDRLDGIQRLFCSAELLSRAAVQQLIWRTHAFVCVCVCARRVERKRCRLSRHHHSTCHRWLIVSNYIHSSSRASLDAIDRTLIDFSNNNNHSNSSAMSAVTAARSPFHPHVVSEESYCAPWDLKSQEEKFKLLSEQRPTPSSSSSTITALTDALLHPSSTNHRSISSSSVNNPFQRTRSARTTSFNKKSLVIQELVPPLLPPLPPGGLVPPPPPSAINHGSCQCGSNSSTRNRTSAPNSAAGEISDPSLKKIAYCLNAHAVRSGTDTSRSFVFSSSSPLNERAQRVNTAPAKVDLSLANNNHSEPSNITSQSSTTSLLSTTSSSSIESPLITDETKPMSFEVGPLSLSLWYRKIVNLRFLFSPRSPGGTPTFQTPEFVDSMQH